MKEQWKKQDSDAKLIQNVEEGRPQPIKIELPISAFGLKQDVCCNRLITFLRIAVLFVLLAILSCTAATLYTKYYPRFIVIDEKPEQVVSNQHDYIEENKLSFRNKVYAMRNEQDIASNEIDSLTATSTSASITTSKFSKDNNFDDKEMQFLSEIQNLKNFGNIRVFDPALNQENIIQNDLNNIDKLNDYIYKEKLYLVNTDDDSMTDPQARLKLVNSALDMHQNNYFAERFHLQNGAEPKPIISSIDLQANIKVSNSPDNEFNSDKEGSMEVLKNRYESIAESESNEVVVIPSLKDENIHQDDQDLENYIELTEVDDIEELINGIANAMGLLEESNSEVDQLNEESVAVIQEEIKNSEEKLEIVDLNKVSSAEEKSQEESVAVIQEEIKNDDEGVPNIYLVLEPISEEEDHNTEAGEKSQEKSLENTSADDLDKNISHDLWSVEDKSREILSSLETMNSPQSYFNPDHTESFAVIIAKLLEPFVGNDYKLVHWYYNVFVDPLGLNTIEESDLVDINDKRKVYAAKILYNQNITEYDTDMQMWLNEISQDSFSSDLMNSQKQVEVDTLLQKQILDKLLWKLFLKTQYELNMMTFMEVWEMLDQSNSNHVKCWFLATHPSVRDRELIPEILASMEHRRKLFPDIKNIWSEVRIQLINEDTELKLLNFNYDDFHEEPVPTLFEQRLLVNQVDVINKLLRQEKTDRITEISEETKLPSVYLPDPGHEAKEDEDQLKQIKQLIIEFNAQMKEIGKEYDYAEVDGILKHQKLIEAMKKVGEEYEQTERSAEETMISLIKNHDEIESSEETVVSTTENDDLKEEISPNSDQSESSNTNLNPTIEIKTEYNKQNFEDPSEEFEEAFFKLLAQHDINIKPVENEEEDYDPFDY